MNNPKETAKAIVDVWRKKFDLNFIAEFFEEPIAAAIAHARAETVIVLPKPMGYLVGGVEAIGFKAALDAIRALNPDVKFVEAEEK